MKKIYTGHEAEMRYREWEDKQPVDPKLIEKIQNELKESRKKHPSESEVWDLFSDEAKAEMIQKFNEQQ